MSAVEAALAVLVPVKTPVVHVSGTGPSPGAAVRKVSSGGQVVLLDGRRRSRSRLRRLALDAGLVVDRELVVLPDLASAAFVVEDAVESLYWFWNAFATVPPGRSRGSLLITGATGLCRNRFVLARIGRLVPGRMIIAHRP